MFKNMKNLSLKISQINTCNKGENQGYISQTFD